MSAPNPTASLGFALKTAVTQAIALSATFIVWPWIASPVVTIAVSSLCASAAARFLQLPLPWVLLNTSLPLMTALTFVFSIPNWIFLILLLVALSVYAPALWTRVPYYPTQRAAYALVLAELPTDRPFIFVDVGSGFGELLLFLASKRPHGTFIGVEIGPLPWAVSRLRCMVAQHANVTFQWRDMWSFPLGKVDYLYTFLSPAAMGRLWNKVKDEMKPGSTFISNSFAVPAPCDEEISINAPREASLFVHRFPLNAVPTEAEPKLNHRV